MLIAGGGIAGLEAMLALSELADDRVDIELLTPSDEFVYRPMLVAEPFGSGEVFAVAPRPADSRRRSPSPPRRIEGRGSGGSRGDNYRRREGAV